jgi:O-antigen ligase
MLPDRPRTQHRVLNGWCVVVIVLALSGTALPHALGAAAAGAVVLLGSVVTVIVWTTIRPRMRSRRLPWLVLAYAGWAGASLAWSAWPTTTLVTWLLLALTTLQGVFIAIVLTWDEMVAAITTALKWALGLSLVFELFVSAIWRGPLLSGFHRPTGWVDPILYWSHASLFTGGRVQGIAGNANLIAAIALIALVVFALQYIDPGTRNGRLLPWMALAAYLLYRASSATVYVAVAAVLAVTIAALHIRATPLPRTRARHYIGYAIAAGVAGLVLFAWRNTVFEILGRSPDLTGRKQIWQAVIERTTERPILGWGLATPWLPGEAGFQDWIITGRITMQAHNMWLDVSMQLGIVGVTLLALAYATFIWHAWRLATFPTRLFATDPASWHRPPTSTRRLLPLLVGTVLLVQSVTESGPLLLWGWLFLTMLIVKTVDDRAAGGASPSGHPTPRHPDLRRRRSRRAAAPAGRSAS